MTRYNTQLTSLPSLIINLNVCVAISNSHLSPRICYAERFGDTSLESEYTMAIEHLNYTPQLQHQHVDHTSALLKCQKFHLHETYKHS
jgi:hypothetical protein